MHFLSLVALQCVLIYIGVLKDPNAGAIYTKKGIFHFLQTFLLCVVSVFWRLCKSRNHKRISKKKVIIRKKDTNDFSMHGVLQRKISLHANKGAKDTSLKFFLKN